MERINSSLYRAQVMHCRLVPKVHKLLYDVFMFYIDLDELPLLSKRLWFFSWNKPNVYSFRDSDHLPRGHATLKDNILDYLYENGIEVEGPRIMLLTYPRVWGYVFNPVSFYFVFDRRDEPVCAIAEVGNTFGEIKPYLITAEDMSDADTFRKLMKKHFYVSPFMDPDIDFEFRLKVPGNRLELFVDDYQNGKAILLASLIGQKEPLNNRRLFWSTLYFPWMTLRVILLIHWNAVKLWLKRISWYKKTDNVEFQTGVYRPHKSLTGTDKEESLR